MGLISAGTTIFDAGVVNNTGNMVLVSATTLSSAASSITFTLNADYKE